MTMRPVTLLIPTYNRARSLEAVWPSYAGIPEVASIVVVDDGSTDGTREVVARLKATTEIPVTYIRHERRQGQQASRRTAIAAAATPWVLFGEDDVWLGDGYCATLLREASDIGAVAIAGRLVTARVPDTFDPAALVDTTPDAEGDIVDMNMLDADFAKRPKAPVRVPFLHTIALIRRELFDRVTFDTMYSGNGWREETDFYLNVVTGGDVVVFTPNAVCWHLRGPISALGGQRIARWRVEYHAWRNTLRLVRKHWPLLSSQYGFRGTPAMWTAGFMARRERAQLRRLRGGHRSSFRA